MYTSHDQRGELSAPTTGQVGQTVYIQFSIASFERDPKTKQPVENGLRNMWVTETALSTALNTAYFAEQVATFAIVMGGALLLAGIGFGVLSLTVLAPVTKREGSRAQAGSAAVASA